ncbi:hypothetical protein SANA_25400 [Gottschalkiaceae bacterium SANA]|nr:hypothetical protein SANA_25400 [Gottschalkiaceae bacterium SANA]
MSLFSNMIGAEIHNDVVGSDNCPIAVDMNVVVSGVFLGVLLVLTYMGQIGVVKKILFSLGIEA